MKIESTLNKPALRLMDNMARGLIYSRFMNITEGFLEIEEAYRDGEVYSFGDAKNAFTSVRIRILHPRAYTRMAFGGSIGCGESYMDGDWTCEQLTDLIRIFARNREVVMQIDNGIMNIVHPISKFFHRLRKNSITGSEKNIHAHYDLGNDFFELFLDPSWMYSSGVYLKKESTLEEAQFEKLDRICRKLRLSKSDHLIEIGTGWGGFAIHAARHYGCKVTTTTISKKQFELANERVKAAGLQDQIEILYLDYRLLQGKYDKLVSIEMIEAVGLEFLGTYFEKCSSLLKDDGEMLIQAITIKEQYYENAKNSVDFIQRYIFPGSGIPSVESISKAVKENTDLQMTHMEDFGPHYARTLAEWAVRLKSNHSELLKRGYEEELYRMWQFYFSYCEGGFSERSIGVMQLKLSKPGSRHDSWIGEVN